MAEETMKDFERELNASFRVLNEGDIVDGMIVDINDEVVTLDIGYYVPGVVPINDISDDPDFSPMRDIKIGDNAQAVVIEKDDGKGNVLLSMKEANQAAAWDKLRKLFESQEIVNVRIKEQVPSGVIAYLEGIRAFIPASQLSLSFVEDTSEYVGKQLDVRVITVDENADKLVLSAKSVLREKEDDSNRRQISAIAPGAIFNGTVETLQPYGAFVQLENGLTGLVHISKICMKRIKKPSEVLKVGQEVKVKVLKVEDGKLSLSIKDVEMNTSDIIDKNDSVDDVPPTEYKSEEIPNNPFAALLSGIKLD
jgi:small subunit ribosomal protein S1